MPPQSVRLSAIDLNLLVAFDAVMQERSVSKAADRLGLSQPALSHALARLRHMLKDELLIRTPKGMVPTPRADQLALPVRRALDELRRSLEPPQFDPSAATRTFRVAMDNYAAVVLVAPLVRRIGGSAPRVRLQFLPSGTLNVPDLLDRGELDLAIGPSPEPGQRFSRRHLLADTFVALLRRNHAAALAPRLTVELFAALPHLEVSSSRHETFFIDDALAPRKLARRIALDAPFLSVVRILAASDAVAVLPRRIARELTGYRPLVVRDLPIPAPDVTTEMIWPRWFDNEPGHRWLREIVGVTAKGLHSE